MSECVLDASSLLLALSGKTTEAVLLRKQLAGARTHAPHLIDAEVGNVLRRHERQGLLSPEEALLALRAAPAVVDHRYPHGAPLSEMAWSLRHNLSFYDGLYVALAALLDLPLLTADGRLGRAPGLPCTVELV
ncbi:MAG: type II toxin-antitoxin system VapC family toxin [Actinobacteria bacterium]|nr:type II toxin-antitoxin system VapC family toxin [Actinomycetota bacterium]